MLNWLTSKLKKPEDAGHPLARAEAIAGILAGIPGGDPQRVLLEINPWLDDIAQLAEQLSAEQLIRAVETLDEFAQPAARAYWSTLLANAAAERQGILSAVPLYTYLTHSHAANRRLFELAAARRGEADKQQLTRSALRALQRWTELNKLGRMAYRTVDPQWWAVTHALVRQARDAGILNGPARAYPDTPQASSVWKEYRALLLFESAPLANLSASEIDAADRLVHWIEPQCRYVDSGSPLTPFCIEPDSDDGPRRCRADATYGAEFRFFGPGQGYNQLVQLAAQLSGGGEQPEWLAASGCSREQTRELLQTLIRHWSPSPPSRTLPRQASSGEIRVVHGLPLVRRMIAASEFARSGRSLDYEGYLKTLRARQPEAYLVEDMPPPPKTPMDVLHLLETAGDRQMMESWEVIDSSASGLGVRFTARRPWQCIGALLAFRREDELDWRIGVIRRLGASHGAPAAGLAVFQDTPQCSQIRLSSSAEEQTWSQQTRETSGLGWHDAILLSASAKLLIIPAGCFSADRPVHISVAGRWRPARLVKLTGRGNDYELAVFREVGGD